MLLIFRDYEKVLCQICQKFRHAKKYKRHLMYHTKQGKISVNHIPLVLFQTKYTRAGSKLNENYIRQKKVCNVLVRGTECMTCVIDLPTHLHRVHHLCFPDPKFIDAMDDRRVLERQVFYDVKSRDKYNPLFHFGVPRTVLDDDDDDDDDDNEVEMVIDAFHQNEKTLSSVLDFPPSDTNESILETTAFLDYVTSPKILQSLNSFGSYLLTVSGGSRTQVFKTWIIPFSKFFCPV